jgi:hypothetical protein
MNLSKIEHTSFEMLHFSKMVSIPHGNYIILVV